MKRSKDIPRLTRLYLSYHLNKMVCIILIIFLCIWSLVLLMHSGFPLEMKEYLMEEGLYHASYFEQSLFFLQLIDGVFIAFLIGAEITSLASFDPMFVPNVSRWKIFVAKILANAIFLFFLLLIQVLLFYFIGVLIFTHYQVEVKDFALVFFLFLSLLEILLIGEFVSMLLNSYFIPILIFILHILSILLARIDKISNYYFIFFPQITTDSEGFHFHGEYGVYFGICILFGMATLLIFQKKDISYS